jgi:DNA-binding transcriptional MerR regulator
VSSRTYLSIGDVLTLLREEFPDVTISKIRFLESQGLVNPERSPSGYRKFFEADVERLRWVLRQQREHFLPLKVIRDRLDAGDLTEGGEPSVVGAVAAASTPGATVAAAAGANGKVPARAHAVAGAGVAGRSRAGGLSATATAPRTEGRSEEQSTQADDEAMARILADASRRVGRVPETARQGAPLQAVPDPGAPHTAGHTDVLNVPREHDAAVAAAATAAAVTEGLRADPDAPHAEGSPALTGSAAPASTTSPVTGDAAHEPHAAPRATGTAPPAPAVPARALTPDATGASNLKVSAGTGTAPGAGVTAPPAADARAAAGVAPVDKSTGAPAAGAAGRSDGGRQGGTDKRSSGTGGGGAAGAGAGSTGPGARAGGTAAEKGGGAAGTPPPSTSGMVTGASLTSEELCAASGLSEIELAGLQGFGLIEPVMVAGIPTFDEDALTVANLAAEFRKYGIEARHLRPYRNAVDREMGLIEQVIIPLLRQRNPESRQRAVDAADDLAALGQTMRATLLRTALRRHIGG